jgi:drug/metabolite transporter (DMT)-like permease
MASDQMTDRWRAKDVALFGLITLLFGGAFPAIKAGLAYLPPLLFAAVRYYLAAALLLGFAAAAGHRWVPRTAGDRTAVLAGGTFLIGGTGLTFVGQQFTTSGVAAIIFSLVPVLTVGLAAWLLPAEHLTRLGWRASSSASSASPSWPGPTRRTCSVRRWWATP